MMHETWVKEGDLLWAPSERIKKASRMMAYMAWLEENNGLELNDYHALWEWSVSHVPESWESVWQFFGIQASRPYTEILRRRMPGAQWFMKSQLNYAEQVFCKHCE